MVKETKRYERLLQKIYLKLANNFSQSVPLELVESELKKMGSNLEIVVLLDTVLEIFTSRFKIELLMLPSWATKNKKYKMGKDWYTHIKIKSDLLMD